MEVGKLKAAPARYRKICLGKCHELRVPQLRILIGGEGVVLGKGD
jgi:hypothetical protein